MVCSLVSWSISFLRRARFEACDRNMVIGPFGPMPFAPYGRFGERDLRLKTSYPQALATFWVLNRC